jgi:hypothetical protein
MKISEIINEDSGRVYFEGNLCTIDKPSDTIPMLGIKNRRILIPANVAKYALQTLIGAPVNYKVDFSGHYMELNKYKNIPVDASIGAITSAWIENNFIKVRGYLSTKKFPNIISEIKTAKFRLGMSFEMDNVRVIEYNSGNETFWKLTRIGSFVGVSILYAYKAAYKTSTFTLM